MYIDPWSALKWKRNVTDRVAVLNPLSGVPRRVRAPSQLILRRAKDVRLRLAGLNRAVNFHAALDGAKVKTARRNTGAIGME